MKSRRLVVAALGVSAFALASSIEAATITPITSFDPNTYFVDNLYAGIDFDDDSNGSVAGNRFSGLLPSDGDVTVWGGFGARAGVGGLRLRGPLGFLG